jgi:hypothetical protein
MPFTILPIHPFCENDYDNTTDIPKNCVHCGPLSLGLLPKEYSADAAYLWRAGINPSTNLLVASTSYERGLVGSAATSTPRYWWIAGPINNQATLEAKVKEVVGRLPERAPDNYEPFADYDVAYDWARVNGYALINCNYPGYRLGDYDADTQSLINIESGFLPSFDGFQAKLRNLANPTPSVGFGTANPYAVPHESIEISTTGSIGSPAGGIGQESGIELLSGDHISQLVNPIVSGTPNGIIFEAIMQVPAGSSNSYTLLQARRSDDNSLFTIGWDHVANEWNIRINGVLVYQQDPPAGGSGFPAGTYHFCVAIPQTSNSGPVNLYINGTAYTLIDVISRSWNIASVRFSFGSEFDGTVGSKNVDRVFSAKVHNLVLPWNPSSADAFVSDNWTIAQAVYSL